MGKFKTGQINFSSLKGENKTGRIQSCIQYLQDSPWKLIVVLIFHYSYFKRFEGFHELWEN